MNIRALFNLLKLYAIVALVLIFLTLFFPADAETLYVTASELNGRARPSKSATVEAVFCRGDSVESTGAVHGDWVEIVGGETGTVWCSAKYLSTSVRTEYYRNTSGGRVRIRTQPEGKACGWIEDGKRVQISSYIDDWGYVQGKGWVSMNYFTKED